MNKTSLVTIFVITLLRIAPSLLAVEAPEEVIATHLKDYVRSIDGAQLPLSASLIKIENRTKKHVNWVELLASVKKKWPWKKKWILYVYLKAGESRTVAAIHGRGGFQEATLRIVRSGVKDPKGFGPIGWRGFYTISDFYKGGDIKKGLNQSKVIAFRDDLKADLIRRKKLTGIVIERVLFPDSGYSMKALGQALEKTSGWEIRNLVAIECFLLQAKFVYPRAKWPGIDFLLYRVSWDLVYSQSIEIAKVLQPKPLTPYYGFILRRICIKGIFPLSSFSKKIRQEWLEEGGDSKKEFLAWQGSLGDVKAINQLVKDAMGEEEDSMSMFLIGMMGNQSTLDVLKKLMNDNRSAMKKRIINLFAGLTYTFPGLKEKLGRLQAIEVDTNSAKKFRLIHACIQKRIDCLKKRTKSEKNEKH